MRFTDSTLGHLGRPVGVAPVAACMLQRWSGVPIARRPRRSLTSSSFTISLFWAVLHGRRPRVGRWRAFRPSDPPFDRVPMPRMSARKRTRSRCIAIED
eukprot:6187346-Pleurochrysis_carterae.AAC.2